MDYKDYQVGVRPDNFWFQGKFGLIEILLKKVKLNQNAKILNIGAGIGDDLFLLNKFGKVCVVDIDSKALNLIPSNIVEEKKQGDICNIPYDDNNFDLVVASDVLEHIKNDTLAVKEIHRVLKNNGIFIFTVPAWNFLYSHHDKFLEHHRRYNKKMLKGILSNYFDFKLNYWMCFLFPFAISQRFIAKKIDFVKKAPSNLPKFINNIGGRILKFENYAISKGFSLPTGLTLYGICHPKQK